MTSPAAAAPRKHRILVADDHALVREGIGKVLALDDRLVVGAEATNAAEVLAQLNSEGLSMIVVEQKAVPLPAKRETTIVLHGGRVRYREDRRPTTQELAALYLGEGALT